MSSPSGNQDINVSATVKVAVDSKDAVKGIEILLTSISRGVGRLFDPEHVAAMARAKKEARILRAEGKVQAAVVTEKGKRELEKLRERAEQWKEDVEMRRQRNRESIAAEAMLSLPGEGNAEKPQEDWIYQFFNCCEDISDEDMQSLWGKLLAGEVASPGSYSIRTLYAVKLLDRLEADIYTKLCSYTWLLKDAGFYAIAGTISGPARRTERAGLPLPGELQEVTPMFLPSELLQIQSAGLVEIVLDAYTLEPVQEEKYIRIDYFGKTYEISHASWSMPLPMGTVLLTSVGMELAKLAGGTPDFIYHERVLEVWKSLGFEVKHANG